METRPFRARRAAAQLLCGPGGATPTKIVARLLAVQAQDLRSARLALRARGEGLTAVDVNRALTVDRSLVVAWLARGTLHLTGREDYPWLLALTAPARLAATRRRLGQEGVSVDESERAVAVVEGRWRPRARSPAPSWRSGWPLKGFVRRGRRRPTS